MGSLPPVAKEFLPGHVQDWEKEVSETAAIIEACRDTGWIQDGDTIEAHADFDDLFRTGKMLKRAVERAGMKLEVKTVLQRTGVAVPPRQTRSWEKLADGKPKPIASTVATAAPAAPLTPELEEWKNSPLDRIEKENVAVVLRLKDGTRIAVVGNAAGKSKAPPGAIVFTVEQMRKQLAAKAARAAKAQGGT